MVPAIPSHNKLCLICYEECSPDDWVTLRSCAHAYCRDCVQQHAKQTLLGKVRRVQCPDGHCTSELDRVQLSELIKNEKAAQDALRRLDQLNENPSLIPCPACCELMDPGPARRNTARSKGNSLQCSNCYCRFCRIHGQSHPSLTCEEFYQTPDYQRQLESERIIQQHSVACSRCGARLQKREGCNYVVCGCCNGDMCYLCRTHKYLRENKKTGFRHCQRCLTAMSGDPGCGMITFFLFAAFTVTVVWSIFAAVVVVASGCCCCCFFGGSFGRPRDDQNPNQRFSWERGMLGVVTILLWPLAVVLLDVSINQYLPAFLSNRRDQEIPAGAIVSDTGDDTLAHETNEDDDVVAGSTFDVESQSQASKITN